MCRKPGFPHEEGMCRKPGFPHVGDLGFLTHVEQNNVFVNITKRTDSI